MLKFTKDIIDTVVLKCDSQKNFNEIPKKTEIWNLQLSIATTYSYGEDRYRIWTQSKQKDLLKYLDGKNIVCYNGVGFDIPLIVGYQFKDPNYHIHIEGNKNISYISDIFMLLMGCVYRTNTLDTTLDTMRRKPLSNLRSFSLYNIYTATINREINKKIYDVRPPDLYNARKILELVECNMYKLRTIKKLYEFILLNRYVVNGDYDVIKLDKLVSPNNVDYDMFLPF
jgi:hypothetical protein